MCHKESLGGSMSIVTVYSSEYYDEEQSAFFEVKGKCTKEKIESMGWRILKNTAQNVDEELLNETGRYLEKQ
jgi:hypothetical protein